MIGRLSGLVVAGTICAMASAVTAQSTLKDFVSVQMLSAGPKLDMQTRAVFGLGVKHVRISVKWSEVETVKGSYSWTLTDSRIRPLLAAGIKPLIVLYGANPLYKTTSSTSVVASPASDAEYTAWGAWAAAVVAHYDPAGMYEIWNEPNISSFWKPKPSAANYSSLATLACTRIHAASPAAKVYVLAMNGTSADADYQGQFVAWPKAVWTPELAACADGVSVHPYRGVRPPETYTKDIPVILSSLPGARSLVISEWGYAPGTKTFVDDELQASYAARLLLTGARNHQFVNLFDVINETTDGSHTGTFGLIDSEGHPRPGYAVVQNLLATIGDWTVDPVTPAAETGGVFAARFTKGARVAYAMWTDSVSQTVSYPSDLSGCSVLTVDLASSATAMTCRKIVVGSRPILVMSK